MSSHITLATSFYDKTFRNAIVMVNSFLNNYSGEDVITMYCFVPEDIIERKQEFLNFIEKNNKINLIFLTSKKWNAEKENNKILSNPAWHKLFMASELNDLSRVLYISPNSLFQRDSEKILTYKYSGAIAGVIDEFAMSEILFKNQNLIYYWYDNMYIDLDRWRTLEFENWVVQYTKNLFIDTINKENDALNIFFNKYSRAIPYYFGFPVRMQSDMYFSWILSSPINIVFRGEHSPWTMHPHHPYEILWRNEYFKIFKEDAPLEKVLKNVMVGNE